MKCRTTKALRGFLVLGWFLNACTTSVRSSTQDSKVTTGCAVEQGPRESFAAQGAALVSIPSALQTDPEVSARMAAESESFLKEHQQRGLPLEAIWVLPDLVAQQNGLRLIGRWPLSEGWSALLGFDSATFSFPSVEDARVASLVHQSAAEQKWARCVATALDEGRLHAISEHRLHIGYAGTDAMPDLVRDVATEAPHGAMAIYLPWQNARMWFAAADASPFAGLELVQEKLAKKAGEEGRLHYLLAGRPSSTEAPKGFLASEERWFESPEGKALVVAADRPHMVPRSSRFPQAYATIILERGPSLPAGCAN